MMISYFRHCWRTRMISTVATAPFSLMLHTSPPCLTLMIVPLPQHLVPTLPPHSPITATLTHTPTNLPKHLHLFLHIASTPGNCRGTVFMCWEMMKGDASFSQQSYHAQLFLFICHIAMTSCVATKSILQWLVYYPLSDLLIAGAVATQTLEWMLMLRLEESLPVVLTEPIPWEQVIYLPDWCYFIINLTALQWIHYIRCCYFHTKWLPLPQWGEKQLH